MMSGAHLRSCRAGRRESSHQPAAEERWSGPCRARALLDGRRAERVGERAQEGVHEARPLRPLHDARKGSQHGRREQADAERQGRTQACDGVQGVQGESMQQMQGVVGTTRPPGRCS